MRGLITDYAKQSEQYFMGLRLRTMVRSDIM